MWLNVIQVKLTSKECWPAVSPAILGMARCLQQGHLVTLRSCLLAVLRKVLLQQLAVVVCVPFCALVFPIPPALLKYGPGKYWLVSIPRIVQCDGAWWGPFAGLPWIPPPHVRALPDSTNFVGTNSQAHLLVMSFMVGQSPPISRANERQQQIQQPWIQEVAGNHCLGRFTNKTLEKREQRLEIQCEQWRRTRQQETAEQREHRLAQQRQ